MKFFTIVFCMSAFQLCSISGQSGSRPISREQRARYFLNALKDVGTQFADDVNNIIDEFKDNPFVMDYIIGVLDISGEILEGRRRRIDVSTVRRHSNNLPNEYRVIDDANILDTILLRQLPSERISGVLTLFFALRNGATNEQIENALGYMYGSKTNVQHPNIPAPATQSCSSSRETEYLATVAVNARNSLKSSVDINSKVLRDVDAIFEKFPCNYWISGPLGRFAEDLKQTFHADASKIDVCTIKKNWKRRPMNEENINSVNWSDVLKIVLSTRLTEEVYNGLIGVMQTFESSVTNKQIENALAYLYGSRIDAVPATC